MAVGRHFLSGIRCHSQLNRFSLTLPFLFKGQLCFEWVTDTQIIVIPWSHPRKWINLLFSQRVSWSFNFNRSMQLEPTINIIISVEKSHNLKVWLLVMKIVYRPTPFTMKMTVHHLAMLCQFLQVIQPFHCQAILSYAPMVMYCGWLI